MDPFLLISRQPDKITRDSLLSLEVLNHIVHVAAPAACHLLSRLVLNVVPAVDPYDFITVVI